MRLLQKGMVLSCPGACSSWAHLTDCLSGRRTGFTVTASGYATEYRTTAATRSAYRALS